MLSLVTYFVATEGRAGLATRPRQERKTEDYSNTIKFLQEISAQGLSDGILVVNPFET